MNVDKFLFRNKWYLLNLGIQVMLLLSNPFRELNHGFWPIQGFVETEEVTLSAGDYPRLILDKLLNPPLSNAEERFVQAAPDIWSRGVERRKMRSEVLRVLGRIQNMVSSGYSEASIEKYMRKESAIPFDIKRRVLNRNNLKSDYSGVLRSLSKDYESGISLDAKLKSWPVKKDSSLIVDYYHIRDGWEELVEPFYDIQLLSSDFQRNSEYLVLLIPQKVRRFDSFSITNYGYLEFFIYGFFVPFIVYLAHLRLKKSSRSI